MNMFSPTSFCDVIGELKKKSHAQDWNWVYASIDICRKQMHGPNTMVKCSTQEDK